MAHTVSPYPNGVDTFVDWEDGVDPVDSDTTNYPDDAIEKLERFVGVRPWWWTWASVVEAITWLYYQITGGGASAPPTPSGLSYQPEPSGMTVLVDFSIDTAHQAVGFDYFKVYYADDSSGTNATAVGWFRGTTFNTARWVAGWSGRYWAVSAVALGGAESGLSAWPRPTWPSTGPTPTAVATSSGYNLSWTPITETREYKIYRAQDGSGTNAELVNTVPGTASTYIDAYSTKDYYCLQAILYDGTELPASPWVTGSAPSAPTGCAAAALIGSGDDPIYHVSWAHSYPDTVRKYSVLQWNGVDAYEVVWTGDGTSYDVPGGYNLFEVRATGWGDLYADSASFSDATTPATPAGISFDSAESQVSLDIALTTDTSHRDSGFRHWQVQRADDDAGANTEDLGVLVPGGLPAVYSQDLSTMYYRLRAVDWAGNASGWTAWIAAASGGTVSTSPPHYRSGVSPFYTAADKMRVSRGAIEIDGTLYEEAADTAELDTDDADSYVSGSSEKAANKWLSVYVKGDDDGGWTAKLSDDPPLYPTCSEEFVFTAQVSAEPASAATSISYDNDAGEDDLAAQDVVRIWSDSDHTTVRGAWRLLSVDTGTNTLTVEANNVDAADDDYLTVVHGPPRYRKFGSTWWRCAGTLRLDSSQNILRHDRNTSGWVTYSEGIKRIIANGHASSFYTLSAASYAPPIAGVVRIFFLIIYSTAQIYGHVRTTGSGATTGYDVEGYTKCSETFELHCSPNQAIDYLSSDASASCFLDVYGYLEEL